MVSNEIKNELIQELPLEASEIFLDITEERVLGASKHVQLVGQILKIISNDFAQKNYCTEKAKKLIFDVVNYINETRGQASQAITNSLRIITKRFDSFNGTIADFAKLVSNDVETFSNSSSQSIDAIVENAKREFEAYTNLLAFDYSSTVAKYLKTISQFDGKTLFVPESRCIDGGKEFARIAAENNVIVHFFPDVSMLYFLKKVNAVIIGAETFNPDGTAYNTTGSDIAALCSHELGIPFYVLTPLIKADMRALEGFVKKPVMRDMSGVYSEKFGSINSGKIDFVCPELLPISPDFITAFITEKGIIKPADMINKLRE